MTEPRPGPRLRDRYDVVVVGSGLGGLSCAALLARAGLHVLVAEQSEGTGGYAHAFTREGYTFDSAVRILAEGEMVEALLAHLGVADRCDLDRVDHLYDVDFPGLRLRAPAGHKAFLEAHVRRFPAEAEGLRAFFGLRRQMFLEAAQLPMQMRTDQLDAAVERFPTLFRYRMATLAQVLEDHIRDPRLRALCAALWPYMGAPPSRLSFFAYAQFIGVLIDGPHYCRGSFQRLVDAFATAVTRGAGDVVVRTPVERVVVEDGRAIGVETADGRRIGARVVVSNADARHTFGLLVGHEHLPAGFVRRLGRLRPSMSAFVVHAGSTQDLSGLDLAHETFKYAHWDHERTWADVLAGRPAGMSMSVMTSMDPGLAPPGHHVLIATAVAPYDVTVPWHQVKDRYADALLGEFETVVPGLRDHLTVVQSGTPLTLERYTRNHRGATYGWELTPDQIGGKRLAHRSPVPGLYLTGHWTEEGPASFRVVLSGINTARLVLEELGTGIELPSFKPADIPPLAV